MKTELAHGSFHQASILQHLSAELCATSALTAKPFLAFSTYSYPRSFAVEPFSAELGPNSFAWQKKKEISFFGLLVIVTTCFQLLVFIYIYPQIMSSYELLEMDAYSSSNIPNVPTYYGISVFHCNCCSQTFNY